MTEDGKKKQDEKKPEGNPGADPKKTESENNSPGPIPYDRFKEVNEKARAYETRLAELEKLNLEREKDEEKKRQETLKDQQKFQELATEWEEKYLELNPKFESSEKELETVRALLEQYADSQMELVPELFREIVKEMPLTSRLEWLTKNKDKLGKGQPAGIPATPPGSGQGEMTDDERRKKSAKTF